MSLVRDNVFVFVVCGDAEHIETLHYSLNALKKFSSSKIAVITDSKRNGGKVMHDNVIDIETPAKFSNHQASIYLKTSIHRFLPLGNLYCYLDSDVIAIDDSVDEVFKQMKSPVIFAKDHCTINEFSPYSVNCPCLSSYQVRVKEFRRIEENYWDKNRALYDVIAQRIIEGTERNRRNLLARIYNTIRYYLSGRYYRLDSTLLWDKKEKLWQDGYGEYIEHKYGIHKIIKERMNLVWSQEKDAFLREDGIPFFDLECKHLSEQIEKVFGLKVMPHDWQHWNGGVFLFDDSSHEFLNFWHESTLKIFENPAWKTRDQGTLIATVWKFGLQNHPLLDSRYNYIVDYTNKRQKYVGNLTFKDVGHDKMKAHFLHIFHHFGDMEWNVFQDIEAIVNSK